MDIDHKTTDMGIPDDTTEDIEMESDESDESDESEDRITIIYIYVTTEMNTSQLAIQQQKNNEQGQEAREDIPTHGYYLKKHPTKLKQIVSMTQTSHVTGVKGNIVTIYPKTHAHIMLTQVNVK